MAAAAAAALHPRRPGSGVRARRSGRPRQAGVRGVQAGVALVVVLLTAGATVSNVHASHGNPVKTHPAPVLFPRSVVAPLGRDLAAQRRVADAAFAAWSAAHPARDDAAFTAFVLSQVPPPPSAAVQAQELAELHRLAATRTPDGLAAASWLEVYGRKDAWKLFLGDATELAAPAVREQGKAAFTADTTLAGTITAAAQARWGRQAPSAVDPSLRPGAPVKAKLSYPSKHAVYVYSELAVLSALDPGRRAEFQELADQVAYSRLYAAGHYRSDLVAGALVGDLLGDYEARGLHPAGSLGGG